MLYYCLLVTRAHSLSLAVAAETKEHVRHSSSSPPPPPPLPSPLGGWCSRASAVSLFVCKWARKQVSRVYYIGTHFYLSPGAYFYFYTRAYIYYYYYHRRGTHTRTQKGTKGEKKATRRHDRRGDILLPDPMPSRPRSPRRPHSQSNGGVVHTNFCSCVRFAATHTLNVHITIIADR